MTLRILSVVGTRPNLIKIAPLMEEMASHAAIEPILLHTGQHYDDSLSQIFFDELGIPRPDSYLGVGSGTHAEQTARIMMAFEPALREWNPDQVLVVGDVNSTLACSLTAAKMHIPIIHVEAGLRSFDRTMPEEINRLLTDQIADLLFTTERDADDNLQREGVSEKKIHFVGNVMIDTLLRHREQALRTPVLERFHITAGQYAVVTLHRPSNVDDVAQLGKIVAALERVNEHLPLVLPLHPRTRRRLSESGLLTRVQNRLGARVSVPLGYLEFLHLMARSRLVLTDSGGIQEETTILGVPCLTLRLTTERPVTITEGTNRLIGDEPERIVPEVDRILSGDIPEGGVPKLWDGMAAQRIIGVLSRVLIR